MRKARIAPSRSAPSEADLNVIVHRRLQLDVRSRRFFCFDNDMKVHAPFDLQQLAGRPA